MAQLSPLESQLRECFGRVAYSHKTHEKCADICHARLSRLKVTQIWLSAFVTGGILTALFAPDQLQVVSNVTSAVLSTALLILNAYAKDIDPGQLSEKHKETAAALWNVRESYLSLLADLRQGSLDENVIRTRRDELQASLAQIYRTAPRTTASAYRSAQLGLQQNEELTFTDKELDELLPPALRITSGKA
jgi:hypothetical protein